MGSVERFGREPSAARIGEVQISQMKSGECGEPHFRELEPARRLVQTLGRIANGGMINLQADCRSQTLQSESLSRIPPHHLGCW